MGFITDKSDHRSLSFRKILMFYALWWHIKSHFLYNIVGNPQSVLLSLTSRGTQSRKFRLEVRSDLVRDSEFFIFLINKYRLPFRSNIMKLIDDILTYQFLHIYQFLQIVYTDDVTIREMIGVNKRNRKVEHV